MVMKGKVFTKVILSNRSHNNDKNQNTNKILHCNFETRRGEEEEGEEEEEEEENVA